MDEPVLLRRFGAWLTPPLDPDDADRGSFFQDGLIVLDTNVLLSLYEYTAPSREQVLAALDLAADRLWLPYQVGLEFVRGRRSALESRRLALIEADKLVRKSLSEASETIRKAADRVSALMVSYSGDAQAIAALEAVVGAEAVRNQMGSLREAFNASLTMLRRHDVALGVSGTEDPILPRIAQLYGDRVGEEPDQAVLRNRVEESTSFRFPNRIPPGFEDGGKNTPLSAAGDYLLWEEIIQYVNSLGEGNRRVLLVSNDTKGDWYERVGTDSMRPWPLLSEELGRRAGAALRIETAPHFYEGVRRFLNADLAADTYAEIERVSESFQPEKDISHSLITSDNASGTPPSPKLVHDTTNAVGLGSAAVRSKTRATGPARRLFLWWLIGAAVQLQRREPEPSEPHVEITAACRGSQPPSPDWVPGTELPSGEWLHRKDSWLAPWFLQALHEAPTPDRLVLAGLAMEQAELSPKSSY